jgi:curved DNA-binding protein CbpA
MTTAVLDPYKALNLPHDASAAQIKRSYRELARRYHPDRCSFLHAGEGKEDISEEELARRKDRATAKFAAIASAYAVLSDPQRKAQYDHVYKYGGYDDDDNTNDNNTANDPRTSSARHHHGAAASQRHHGATQPPPSSATRKRKSTGIGYACVDPLAFLWTHGRVHTKMAVAGIQIPSRLHQPATANVNDGVGSSGFRFAFSSAHLATSPNGSTKVWQSKTTSYCGGQKFTRVETTTIHPDGRTETVVDHNPVQNDDHGHDGRDGLRPSFFSFGGGAGTGKKEEEGGDDDHRSSAAATTTAPWYAHAWSGIKDKIMMCYSPCTVTAVS